MFNTVTQSKVNDLVYQALVLAAKAHVWHLAVTGQGSYAQHMALGALYEYFHDIADRISETAQGNDLNPLPNNFAVRFTFTGPDSAVSDVQSFIDNVQAVSEYIDESENEASETSDYDYLENIFQEIIGNLYAHLYKLKKLA